MARKPHPREDFVADATAMAERIELRLAGRTGSIAAGFRSDGSLTILFGEDPVFQFNSHGQLRRVFADDRLYKADAGRLVAVVREHQGGRVQLISQELPAATAEEFVGAVAIRLSELARQIVAGQIQVVARVPAETDVLARLSQWLGAHASQIQIAASPHAR